MIKAGTMDRRITIQTKAISYDTAGSEVVTWSDVATVWANVENGKRDPEKTEGKQLTASESTTFTIRYISNITPAEKIIYESKNYDITSVNEIGRREALSIDAMYKDNK